MTVYEVSRHGLPQPPDPERETAAATLPGRKPGASCQSAEDGFVFPELDRLPAPTGSERARARRRRWPRLRWAIQHPLHVLRRNGFGAVLSLGILLFVGGWILWLLFVYATHPF
ncbi:hypothetical protein [Streptomyces sp. NPDC054865]